MELADIPLIDQHAHNLLKPDFSKPYPAANLESILLDDGFLAKHILPLEWHQKFLPVHRKNS